MGRATRIIVAGSLLAMAMYSPAGAQTADELYAQAVEARKAGATEDATSLLRRALELEPDNADALVQLGFALLAADDREGARSAFDKVLSIAPGYTDAKFGLAQLAFRDGDLVKADALNREVLSAQPDYADAAELAERISRARAGVIDSKPVRSPVVKTAAPLRAEPRPTALERATALRLEGRFALAEAEYRRALAADPGNTDALVGLGLVLAVNGDPDEAQRLFLRTLDIAPSYIDARAGLLRLALARDDVPGARGIVDDLSVAERENADIAVLAGRLLMREHSYRQARDMFQSVLERDPSNADALIGLGDAQQALGQYSSSRATFEKARALDPGSQAVLDRMTLADQPNWRLDLGTEYSTLSGDRPSWTDTIAAASYRLRPDTTLTVSGRLATRGDVEDVQLGLRVDHRFSTIVSAHGGISVTPDGDFLPDATIAGGLRIDIPTDTSVSPFLDVDLRHDRYSADSITTLAPGVGVQLGTRVTLYGRWIHSASQSGATADGYLVRADVNPFDRLGFFVGYSDAPEIDSAALIDTQTWFVGASLDLAEGLAFRINYSNESRTAFDRKTVGAGLSYRF
ncbi:tetratricopeptide repeat protein [Pseudohoeflea suaedae]|uniref:Tetratricopeptide repeat protein n=1 Tax=Pseudohoeflea suaedae TaxID=877384 RepID=A0A4R5PMJ2_9HYPH|nr:tetratricopeptide repeat protein [Pseudohoeflea suaedae]TDH38119.1 tetratricopeptide repeat protein [Pseudohoeflea suaedae]